MQYSAPTRERLLNIGIFVIRITIGSLMLIHGLHKLQAGANTWIFLGKQLEPFGITFYPALWGFLAACTEFIGGIMLILGLATRFAALAIACVMITAFMFHIRSGDPYQAYSHPLAILGIMLGLMCSGSGYISLDYWIHTNILRK